MSIAALEVLSDRQAGVRRKASVPSNRERIKMHKYRNAKQVQKKTCPVVAKTGAREVNKQKPSSQPSPN